MQNCPNFLVNFLPAACGKALLLLTHIQEYFKYLQQNCAKPIVKTWEYIIKEN